MSISFKNGWNKEKPAYAKKFGKYQAELNMLTQPELKAALSIAMMLYKEGMVFDMLKAANGIGPGHVEVEQGAHQWEDPMDDYGRKDLEKFDKYGDDTLHFTLRYQKTPNAYGLAFHCYLAKSTHREKNHAWSVTTITYKEHGAGIQFKQTGSRDFMAMLAKRFVMAHGEDDDD